MAALSSLLPLVVVFLLRIQGSLAEEAEKDKIEYPRVIIVPDSKEHTRTLKIGEQYTFTCTFEAKDNDRHTKADELKWTDEWGTLINSDSTKNEYSKTMSGKTRRMLLLVIHAKEVTDKPEGKKFVCEAKQDGVSVQKSVQVRIVGQPSWKTAEGEVTGRLGESLEINCDSIPTSEGTHVDTIMNFENGTELPSRYEASGGRLFIKPLTMAERNAVVKCTALETHSDQDVVLTAEKTVKINLQFPPVFAQDNMKRYGILGRKVTLPCRVIDSNPRVSDFEFFATEKELKEDGSKYQIDLNHDQQVAVLTINDLTDEDFEQKDYHCRARTEDSLFEKEMTFTLHKALPPETPEVTFKKSWKSKIEFEIKEVTLANPENPPVTQFEIRFVNFNDVKDVDEVDRKSKLSQSWPRVFNKTASNIYTVDHLHWNTLYTFEIRAVNEAGNSDAVVYNATTLEETAAEPMTGSASSALAACWCILASSVLMAMWYSKTEVSRH